jgi:hypothetical protein
VRDLHQPSVNTRADEGANGPSLDPPPEVEAPLTGTEVMQVEGSTPPANHEPDWHVPYLDHLTRGDLPQIRPRLDGSLTGPSPLSYLVTTKSCTATALRASYNAISQMRKARICLKIYTRGLAVITRHLEPLLEMHSDKVSIGQPQSPTLSS